VGLAQVQVVGHGQRDDDHGGFARVVEGRRLLDPPQPADHRLRCHAHAARQGGPCRDARRFPSTRL
jgi:hypothetical protein